MNVLSRTIAILITMATLGNCAHATTIEDFADLSEPFIMDLSERDYLTAGDNGLTYDATTGLEWLDFSYTLGNSVNDTELESFYGDFRWATSDEVSSLLWTLINGTKYVIYTENYALYDPRGIGIVSKYRELICNDERPCPYTVNPLVAFLQLFSDDYNDFDPFAYAPGDDLIGGDYDSYVTFLTGFNKRPTAGANVSSLQYVPDLGHFTFYDQFSSVSNKVANPVAGSWLVRQAATSVPEPSTLVIFTLGLLGLASRRFSKKS